MARFSHSRLGTFQQCRYQYKLKYIDKIKVDVPETVEMFLGKRVHETLERLYRDLQFQKARSKEELLSYFDEKWNKLWNDKILIVNTDYSADHYKAMGRKFVVDYFDHYAPFDHSRTLGIETDEVLALSDGNTYDIRIDRLACDKEGNYLTGWGSFGKGPEQLNQPEDIAVNNKGLIYVTDTRNSRVQILEVKN